MHNYINITLLVLFFCFNSVKCETDPQSLNNLRWYYSTDSPINNWYFPDKNIKYWNTMVMNGTVIGGNYTTLYARTNYVVNIGLVDLTKEKKEILPMSTLTLNLKYKSGIVVYANGREIYRQYLKEDSEGGYASGTNKEMTEKTIIIPADILESLHEQVKDGEDIVTGTNYIVTIGIELHKYNDEEANFRPSITFEYETYPITRYNEGELVKSSILESAKFKGECVNIARKLSLISSSGLTESTEIEKAFNEKKDKENDVWTQPTSKFPVDRPFIEFSLEGNPTTILTHFGYVIDINKKESSPKSIELYGMNSNGKYELIGKDSKNHMIEYKSGNAVDRVVFGLPDNTKSYTNYKIVMQPQLDGVKSYKDISIKEFLMYSCKEVICQRYLDLDKAKTGTCLNNVRNPLYNYGNTQTCCSIDGKWHNFYDKEKNEEITNFKYPKSVYNIKSKDRMTILPSYNGVVTSLSVDCKKKSGNSKCDEIISSKPLPPISFDSKSGVLSIIGDLPKDTYIITIKYRYENKDIPLTTLTIVVSNTQNESDCKAEGDWPNAMVDERIRIECADGTVGYRYRTCLDKNKWSEIDKSNCKNNFTLVATKEMSYIRKRFTLKNTENSFDNLFDNMRRKVIIELRTKLLTSSIYSVNPNNEDVIFEYIKPDINVKRDLSSEIDVRMTVRVYPYHETSDDDYFDEYTNIIKNIINGSIEKMKGSKSRILDNDDDGIIRPTYPPTNFTYKIGSVEFASGHSFEFIQNDPFILNSAIEFPACIDNPDTESCLNDLSQVTYIVKSGKLPFEITLFSNGTLSGTLTTILSGNVTIEATFKETKLEYVFIYSSYGCKADGYWPASTVNTLVTLPCFDKYDGEMNRTCNGNGEWSLEVSSCTDPGILLRPSSSEVFLQFTLESDEKVFKDVQFKNLYRTKVSELSGINVNQFLYDSETDNTAILIVNSTNQKAADDKTAVENVLKNDAPTQAVKDVDERYTYVKVTNTGFQQVSGYRKKSSGNDYDSATIAAIVLACVFGFIGIVVIGFLCCQIGHFSKVLTSPKKKQTAPAPSASVKTSN